LRAPALRGNLDLDLVPGNELHADHGGGVVLRVPAAEIRLVQHRGAQLVFRIEVGAAHALVDRLLEIVEVQAHPGADLQEHVDDAGVLADRAMAFRAHPRIGEDLRDRVLRRRRLLALVGAAERADVIGGVVIRNKLQRVRDALHQVFRAEDRHLYRALIWCFYYPIHKEEPWHPPSNRCCRRSGYSRRLRMPSTGRTFPGWRPTGSSSPRRSATSRASGRASRARPSPGPSLSPRCWTSRRRRSSDGSTTAS